MIQDEVGNPEADQGPFTNPWPALAIALVTILLTLLWLYLVGERATPLRVLLLAVGLLAAGAAVVIRPQSFLVLVAAAGLGWLGCFALNPDWDSVRLALGVLSTFAGFAALVVLLPRVARRVVVSVLILIHFGGILSAVTNVSPQPWLSSQLWTHFYRPYLEFMYLNNAYHFYSPDPGPPTLLWCYIKYQGGSARWVKLPNRDDYPLMVCYQRRLSLTESINQLEATQSFAPHFQQHYLARRQLAGNILHIPLHPQLDPVAQFRPPVPFSKMMLATYARHLARTSPHLTDPEQQVTSIKMYRVVHNLPTARDLTLYSALDETSYLPYYLGEYDPEGKLIDSHDPFLYWLIPIFRVAKGQPGPYILPPRTAEELKDYELKDHLKVHAESGSVSGMVPD